MQKRITTSGRRCAKRRISRFDHAIQTLEQRLLFASFLPGNLAVERVGNGGAALAATSATNAAFIDEFIPTGGSTQSPLVSVALPTATGTGSTPNPLTVSASFGEGLMNLSTDGHYLVVPGYAIAPNGTLSTATRAIGRISASGSIDTTTSATNMGTGNFRGAISTDGSGFWTSTSTSGVVYVPYGGSGASGVQISNTASGNNSTLNTRAVAIFNGQLYVDGASAANGSVLFGPGTVGSGLPTTGTVPETELNGFPTAAGNGPFQFVFKDANTIYVADSNTTGNAGIQKWTQSGGTWTLQYTTLVPGGVTADSGLVGLAMDSNGVLYGTTTNATANRVVKIVDTGSGTVGTTAAGGTGFTITTLATAPANESFRGISLTPEAPTVGGVTATPSSIFTNGTTTLAAQNVVEVGGSASISSVSFYREAVTGTQNTAVDTLIPGTATQSGTTWTLSGVGTSGLAAGNYTYYAVATDANGTTSAAVGSPTTVLTINNASAPTIASFSATPSTDNVGVSTALTATNVQAAAGDSIASVKFYVETGITAGFSGDDTLLGSGTASGNNYTLNFTPSSVPLAGGSYTVYAVATATSSAVSTASPTSLVVVVPQVAFDVSAVSVSEAAGTESITVDRTGDTVDPVTVQYTTVNGTAIAGTNFGTLGNTSAVTGTVSFAANATSATFSIPIINQHGLDKTFTITLGNATPSNLGTTISATPETVTIQGTAVVFSLSSPTYSVNESVNGDGVGTAIFSVIRSGLINDTASVAYSTSDGSGHAGTNYNSSSGTISFASGQTVGTLSVPILAPSPQNGNKTFVITLSSPSADNGAVGILGTQTTATATIIDSTPLTNNLSSSSATLSDIESGGPFTNSFFPVLGSPAQPSGSFSFIAFEIMEFSKAGTPSIYPTAGNTITSLQNLSLQLFNTTNSGTFNGHPGNFNVYFIPNSDATSPTSGFSFQAADVNGLNGQGGTGPSTLIGTFSFNDALGYETYTPATIPGNGATPTGVAAALISALNSGSNFRLAVTPQTTDMVADWAGSQAGETPTLSFSATVSQQVNIDKFDLSAPTYTVNENAGTATITVNRTYTALNNPTSDAASVNYTTSDASAHAGTNYTASSGTLSFASGQFSASFTVPLTDLNPMGGNKFLNLTLSSPVSQGSNTSSTLGLSSATLTIVDTHAAGTPTNIVGWSNHNAYVKPAGPTANTTFLDILGSSNGATAAFGALDFNVQDGSGYQFTLANPVTAINSITLGLVNSPFSSSANGTLDVYLVSADRSLTDTSLTYDTSATPEGLSNQLGTKILLGQIAYHTSDPTTAYSLYTLSNYNQAALDAIKADLNGNLPFRFALTDESSTTSGTFVGVGFGSTANFPNDPNGAGFDGPQLSLNVDEAAALPGWLDPASNATWDPNQHTLNVTGTAKIVSDPGGDAPIITVNGAAAQLSIAASADSTINIPSLTVSNGGAVSVVAASTPHDPVVLSIPTLSLSTGGKLNLTNNELITTATQATAESLLQGGGLFTNSAGALGYADHGSGQTEVRFTLAGDANLDGVVNTTDFMALAGNFNGTGKFWSAGDFNYDAKVNALDFNAVATNFGGNVGGGFSAPSLGAHVSSASTPFSSAAPIAAVLPAPSVSGSFAAASGSAFSQKDSLVADVLGSDTSL